MAYSCRHLIVLVAFLGLAAVFVRGQTPTPPEEIEITFTVFAPRAIKGLGYFPTGDKKPLTGMKFYNSYRSPVFHYRGEAVLYFYDEAEVAAAMAAAVPAYPGGPVPAPVLHPIAACAIPAGVTKAFLLFIPRHGPAIGGFKYDVSVMDDGETGVPPGHFVIINASNLEFVARINKVDTKIHCGVSPVFKADRGLVILLAVRTEPEFHKLMIADQWDLGPRQRNLLIFFPPKSATALLPEIVRLNDEVPDNKAKKQP